jgi:hypothetical protein
LGSFLLENSYCPIRADESAKSTAGAIFYFADFRRAVTFVVDMRAHLDDFFGAIQET